MTDPNPAARSPSGPQGSSSLREPPRPRRAAVRQVDRVHLHDRHLQRRLPHPLRYKEQPPDYTTAAWIGRAYVAPERSEPVQRAPQAAEALPRVQVQGSRIRRARLRSPHAQGGYHQGSEFPCKEHYLKLTRDLTQRIYRVDFDPGHHGPAEGRIPVSPRGRQPRRTGAATPSTATRCGPSGSRKR